MSEIKLGSVITLNEQPYVVVFTQHIKVARGSATLRTKLKNLVDGATLEKSFSGGDRIEAADLSRRQASYLYKQDDLHIFMDAENFEQYELKAQTIGEKANYLKDGQLADILLYNGKAVSLELPKKIELKVTNAPPGIRGDTSGSATKTVTLETGAEIRTPLFVKAGDQIRINTETNSYVERA